jgi:hypothetical protein
MHHPVYFLSDYVQKIVIQGCVIMTLQPMASAQVCGLWATGRSYRNGLAGPGE